MLFPGLHNAFETKKQTCPCKNVHENISRAHVIVYFAIFCCISLHLMSGPETFERTFAEAINFQFISLHACTKHGRIRRFCSHLLCRLFMPDRSGAVCAAQLMQKALSRSAYRHDKSQPSGGVPA